MSDKSKELLLDREYLIKSGQAEQIKFKKKFHPFFTERTRK